MRHLTLSLTLGLLALLVVALPTSAATRVWCARDPIVSFDGTVVQVWVAIPEEFEPFANGATEVKFRVPKNVGNRQILFTDAGFNGHGEKVSFTDLKGVTASDGLLPIALEVRVHIDQKKLDQAFGKGTVVPVQVTVNNGTTTESFVVEGITKNTRFQISLTAATTDGTTTDSSTTVP